MRSKAARFGGGPLELLALSPPRHRPWCSGPLELLALELLAPALGNSPSRPRPWCRRSASLAGRFDIVTSLCACVTNAPGLGCLIRGRHYACVPQFIMADCHDGAANRLPSLTGVLFEPVSSRTSHPHVSRCCIRRLTGCSTTGMREWPRRMSWQRENHPDSRLHPALLLRRSRGYEKLYPRRRAHFPNVVTMAWILSS